MCDSKKACKPRQWPGLFFVHGIDGFFLPGPTGRAPTLAAMLWVKSLHIVFVASWFAGLFYLPRIFVNLAMVPADSAAERARLLLMAGKLLRFTTILAVPALGFGLWLWLGWGIGRGAGWMHAKLLVVALTVAYHALCWRMLRSMVAGHGLRGHAWYRWFNELPVLFLLAAVVLVVVKPF
jgi:protoporphyrinogen IX oxidase